MDNVKAGVLQSLSENSNRVWLYHSPDSKTITLFPNVLIDPKAIKEYANDNCDCLYITASPYGPNRSLYEKLSLHHIWIDAYGVMVMSTNKTDLFLYTLDRNDEAAKYSFETYRKARIEYDANNIEIEVVE